MPETLILNFNHPALNKHDVPMSLEEIFFESSTKKEFKDLEERRAFQWKYLGYYLTHFPEYAWVALNGNQVLGYVLGAPFSKDAGLYQVQPHLIQFEKFFEDFPAHLHVNCHSEARGKGVGKLLVSKLVEQLMENNVQGLHIMTGTQASNQIFYQKLGFNFSVIKNEILFMGKSLILR